MNPEQERYNITVGEENTKELIIRKGEALPVEPDVPLDIMGQIDTPRRFLNQMNIDFSQSHLVVNRENKNLMLVLNPKNPYGKDFIKGAVKKSEDLDIWKINNGEYVSNDDMADKIRMNKRFFKNRKEAMNLVSNLRNIKIKVESQLENLDDKRGSITRKREQAIQESNIPQSFEIDLRPFKGGDRNTFTIEVDISPQDFSMTLICPDLKEWMDNEANDLIQGEVGKIIEDYPKLLVIEE